jgi:hypothetical protein
MSALGTLVKNIHSLIALRNHLFSETLHIHSFTSVFSKLHISIALVE